jgi:hypothetical protein
MMQGSGGPRYPMTMVFARFRFDSVGQTFSLDTLELAIGPFFT